MPGTIDHSPQLKNPVLTDAYSWPTRKLRISNPEANRTIPELADIFAQNGRQSGPSRTSSGPKVAPL